MWDCLVGFSTWAESNSGQIQILIAVAALVYAWKAYIKILEQIEISNKQTKLTIKQGKIANRQRGFELKINLLNKIENYISKASVLIKDIDVLNIKLSGNLNTLDDPSMHNNMIVRLSSLRESLNNTLIKCQRMKEILNKYKKIPTSCTEDILLIFSDVTGSLARTEDSLMRIKESLK